MNIPGKRLVLGAAVAVAALGAGGVAYAVGGDDPAPEQGYVTYDQGAAADQGTAATPSPSTSAASTSAPSTSVPSTSVPSAPAPSTPDQSTAPSTKPKQGDGRHRGDCPDKNGSQGRPARPTQPAQPTQPQQTEPAQPQQTQPAQPEQNPADDA
ncbi:hypothetical protein ACFVWG_14235 [Kribbella sp. NPDC058245]|uniref:hypothetical protein n=1 Tax=Kribbella sp. NPDC058245 TaxID=3346399 RepID=UPI0036E73A98